MKKREVFEISYKAVDLGGNLERILFVVNRMHDKITCSKVEAPSRPRPPPTVSLFWFSSGCCVGMWPWELCWGGA